jgi:hypothetical protein
VIASVTITERREAGQAVEPVTEDAEHGTIDRGLPPRVEDRRRFDGASIFNSPTTPGTIWERSADHYLCLYAFSDIGSGPSLSLISPKRSPVAS